MICECIYIYILIIFNIDNGYFMDIMFVKQYHKPPIWIDQCLSRLMGTWKVGKTSPKCREKPMIGTETNPQQLGTFFDPQALGF